MADWELCHWQNLARLDGKNQNSQTKPTMKREEAASSARNRPLVGKSFYLDLSSGKTLEFLAESVRRLGGVIESFLSKEVSCIVSSNREARQERLWTDKQSCSALSNAQAGSRPSAGLQRSCSGPLHKPVDTVRAKCLELGDALISRGKKLLNKAIRSQDSTCGNSILARAQSWGVQIMYIDEMLSYIQRLSKRQPSMTKVKLLASGLQPLKVVRLKPPFLKIEDGSRQLRPFFQQFKNFPQLYFLPLRRHSPFEPPRTSSSPKAPENKQSLSELCLPSVCCILPKAQKGYCECCEEAFTELQKHLQSQKHKEFVLDSSHFTLVDSIISQLTNDFVVSSFPTLRMSSATGNGDLVGFHLEAAENTAAAPSGQEVECCLSAEDSLGQPVNPEGSAHLCEDQGFQQLTELPREMLITSVPLALQSLGSASELLKEGRMVANPRSKSAIPVQVEHGAAPQQTRLIAQPAVLSRKRKLSCDLYGPTRKRQALAKQASNDRLPGKNVLPGNQQVGTTGCPPPNMWDSQLASRHLPLSTVPFNDPSPLATPPHISQQGLSYHSLEPLSIDTGCLQGAVHQLGQDEVSVLSPCKGGDICHPCHFPCPDMDSTSMPGFPMGKHTAAKLLGSVAQPCSSCMDISELAQGVFPQQPGLGPSPSLSLPSYRLTSLSTETKSSSSMSEWDGPLLCVLAGASHLPFESPIDAALLGTCVSMRDSNYESHLCSVLWQKMESPACKEDSDYRHSCKEGASLTTAGACMKNWAS